MRASELTPDTASQNSSSSRFSDEETILCELTDYAQRNTERGKHGPEVIAQKLEQTKPSRGCMGSSFANIYVSGSTYGRKTIGSGSGAPAGCATM